MISVLMATILGLAQDLPSGGSFFEGRCDYPAEMGPKKPNEVRIDCDAAVISPSREPNSLMVQFAPKSGGMPIGFAGDVDQSGTLSVRRIYQKPGVPTLATRGHCRIFRNGDDVSGITCVGFIGERAIVANFRAFAP